MEKRILGNSDLNITRIGFGTWAIGGDGWAYGWGAQDDRESIAAIHQAVQSGINWIDTAAAYGLGHSEEMVARALAECSQPRPYVFTKCGLCWDKNGKITKRLTADSIRRECEDSLRRLRMEAIDLYQIHWPPDKAEEVDEAWGTMERLQQEGKVRWIGASNFDAIQLQHAQAIAPVTSLQPPYSLIRREVEVTLLPHCESNGIGVIVYAPMASGMLTGAMTRERINRLPGSDWRRRNSDFQEPKLSRNMALVERLRNISSRRGCTPGEIAIAWTLGHPAVTAAIVGARNTKQTASNIGAATLALDAEEIAEIEQVE